MPLPLPDLSVTWLFRVNVSTAEDTDLLHRARLLLEIANSLLGLGTGWTDSGGTSITGSSPWDVYSSCNSVSLSDTNLWVDTGDLVWAATGVAHSWIVFVHQDFYGTDLPLYLCIDCTQGGSHRNATIGVFFSREPFSEGSTTARPTATGEVEVLPSGGSMTTAPWQGPATADEDHRFARLHCLLGDDGRNFRVVICRAGVDVALWDLFAVPEYEVTEWSDPAVMTVMSWNSDEPLLTWDNIGGVGWYHARDDVSISAEFELEATMTVFGAAAITTLGTISFGGASGWDSPKLAASTPASGLITAIPDMWWGRGGDEDAAFGDDRTFQQFTNLVIPWNTTVCQKS